ncbi:MAG: PHP domain-containing protein [Clostridia bacterium]
MKADLHVHTNISDCNLSPEEVIKEAVKNDLKAISLTDHDTLESLKVSPLLEKYYDIEIVPGLEISAYDYELNRKCHILGYYVKPNKEIFDFTQQILKKRHNNSLKQIENLKKHGYKITIEEVLKVSGETIYKQHIMHILIKKGYAREVIGAKYYELFKNDGICSQSIKYPSMIDAIILIKNAGGLPVLAHPTLYGNLPSVSKMVEAGLMGIEGSYPTLMKNDFKIIKEIANKYGLIITGGSDYHGFYGEDLNNYVGKHYVEDIIVKKMKNRLK